MEQYPLFVYGTLRPGNNNYPHYLAGRTQHEEHATIHSAALYTEGVYPYLTVEPELVRPDDRVLGSLIYVRPDVYEAVLHDVDQLEDYVVGRRRGNLYERVVRQVEAASGMVTAYVYVASAETVTRIREGHMMRVNSEEWHADA